MWREWSVGATMDSTTVAAAGLGVTLVLLLLFIRWRWRTSKVNKCSMRSDHRHLQQTIGHNSLKQLHRTLKPKKGKLHSVVYKASEIPYAEFLSSKPTLKYDIKRFTKSISLNVALDETTDLVFNRKSRFLMIKVLC